MVLTWETDETTTTTTLCIIMVPSSCLSLITLCILSITNHVFTWIFSTLNAFPSNTLIHSDHTYCNLWWFFLEIHMPTVTLILTALCKFCYQLCYNSNIIGNCVIKLAKRMECYYYPGRLNFNGGEKKLVEMKFKKHAS